ncbi:MAG: hypothetical protein GF417_10485 [Candidatus Latescibacteria bacterium]|nr:hypothetical protein [bacterium]MBD3424854.1 hypothetical protein [Candidatus Latescibacterota bacterium]
MKNPHRRKYIVQAAVTAVFLMAGRHLMVLAHEWTHSTAAWLLGSKGNPLDIHYGDWALMTVNENVNYEALISAGRGSAASIIAISALAANLLLFLLCARALSLKYIGRRELIYSFIFWFAVMNIGELFSYIPIRTFTGDQGDIGHFTHGLGISPLVVFIPGVLITAAGLYHLFAREMDRFLRVNSLKGAGARRIYTGLTIFVIFFWFGSSAFYDYGPGSARSLWSLASALTGIALFAVLIRSKVRTDPVNRKGHE